MIAMGVFGSCNQTETVAKEYDSTSLRLAVMPTMDCLPFYYADSLGIFDSLGVKIRLITFDAAMDADTAFKNGDVDGIVSDLVKLSIWRGNGDSLTVAMANDLNLWLVTAQNARIGRVESIKEKIIGITRHSALDFVADKILESVKLQSMDMNKPQINKISLRTLMLDQNQYDGAILPEPFASEAVARGAKRLIGTSELNLPCMMTVLFCDSVAKSHKNEIDNIVNAYNMAVDAINEDTLSNTLDFIPAKSSVYVPDTLFTPQTYKHATTLSDSMLIQAQKWAKERGLIK